MVRVLPIHFGVVLGCKGGGGKKKKIRPRKVFSGAGIPNRAAIGQIFHHARARILFWRGIRFLGPEKFFQHSKKAAQARQANTSQGQPPRSDDLQ